MGISEMSPEMIPAMSTMMYSSRVLNDASVSMLSKTLDNNETQGAALIDMMRRSMERSVYPSLGGNIDVSV